MPTAYFALRAHGASALPPDLEQHLAAALPFEPDRSHHLQRGASHLWAWFKDAHLQPGSSWCDADAGAAAVAGYGLDPEGGPFDAASVARPQDLEAAWHRFHGEWSACCIARDGTLAAASSAPGTEHVYYTEQPSFTAISNRARLLWAAMRAAGQRPEPDLDTLAGLLSVGNLTCTDATAVRGVRFLDSTDRIEIPPQGGPARIRSLDPTYFLPRGEAPSWRAMAEGLRANVRWLLRSEAPVLAALTGGKDSRLVLAAMRAEGVDRKARFYLSIAPEHADFLVARLIADRLGLTLERREPHPELDLIASLRRHVAFTEGALNAWDLKAGTRPYRSQIGVHGLFGELYRGRTGLTPGNATLAALAILPSINRAGILRPGVRRAELGRMRRWLAGLIERGVPRDRLSEAYYYRQLTPRWSGQTKQLDALYGLQFQPLYHPVVLQGYSALPAADRLGERVPFELMRALCPELVSLPFAKDRWDPAMVRRSSAPDTPCAAPIDHAGPMLGSGWQIPALRAAWPTVRALIAGALGSLDAIVVPARVGALLDVAERALGMPMSASREARLALRYPRVLLASRLYPKPIIQQIFALLTLAAFPDELAADPPARVQIA